MHTFRLLLAAVTCVPLALAVADESAQNSDPTTASIAKLKAKLPDAAAFELDEARVTSDGVTCINYFLRNPQGAKTREHAVVQGDEILRSSADAERFDKAWNDHCLGPHGGTTPNQ